MALQVDLNLYTSTVLQPIPGVCFLSVSAHSNSCFIDVASSSSASYIPVLAALGGGEDFYSLIADPDPPNEGLIVVTLTSGKEYCSKERKYVTSFG